MANPERAPDVADLPSFREQIAVVYNDYLSTLGGGERSALCYALALRDLGFTTVVGCRGRIPAVSVMEDLFGEDLSGIAFEAVHGESAAAFFKPAGVSVWVNHTYMSFEPNPGRLGLYSLMFPQQGLDARSDKRQLTALSTYQHFLSNSSFTELYGRALWKIPQKKSLVLHPPISRTHIAKSREATLQLAKGGLGKKKQFVHVGRFNPGSHNKNQKVLMEAFLEASARDARLSEWAFVFVGNVNEDPASRAYHAECQELASRSGGRIRIEASVPFHRLTVLLEESFSYVHGTGAFEAPGQSPSVCEHLGLSILEGMSAGCLPLVYGRGGIFDFLTPGKSGFFYLTPEGLAEGLSLVAGLHGSPEALALQEATLEASRLASYERFRARLADIVCGKGNP